MHCERTIIFGQPFEDETLATFERYIISAMRSLFRIMRDSRSSPTICCGCMVDVIATSERAVAATRKKCIWNGRGRMLDAMGGIRG